MTEPVQRHRSVEIVEDRERPAGREDELGGRHAVRTVRGDHGRIGVRHLPAGFGQDLLPARIETQVGAGELPEVAVDGVVGDVPLEEDHPVAVAGQGPAEPPPEGRVAVAPGRADRQPEDDQLHAARASSSAATAAATVGRRRRPSRYRRASGRSRRRV